MRMSLLESSARDVPPRQRALRTAVTWSHDLLSPEERTLFRRLSVFAGAWTIADAAAVCGDGASDQLSLVEALLDKSMIRRTGNEATAQFTMLESLKEYAAEQLAAYGEVEEMRDRHVRYALAKADPVLASFGIADERAVRRAWSLGFQGDPRVALEHCLATGSMARP